MHDRRARRQRQRRLFCFVFVVVVWRRGGGSGVFRRRVSAATAARPKATPRARALSPPLKCHVAYHQPSSQSPPPLVATRRASQSHLVCRSSACVSDKTHASPARQRSAVGEQVSGSLLDVSKGGLVCVRCVRGGKTHKVSLRVCACACFASV